MNQLNGADSDSFIEDRLVSGISVNHRLCDLLSVFFLLPLLLGEDCCGVQGSRVSRALGEAMQTVQHTKHFAHPANWAGFLLVGSDVRLSNKVALMGQALCELLKTPDRCRDALRVTLHLVSTTKALANVCD